MNSPTREPTLNENKYEDLIMRTDEQIKQCDEYMRKMWYTLMSKHKCIVSAHDYLQQILNDPVLSPLTKQYVELKKKIINHMIEIIEEYISKLKWYLSETINLSEFYLYETNEYGVPLEYIKKIEAKIDTLLEKKNKYINLSNLTDDEIILSCCSI